MSACMTETRGRSSKEGFTLVEVLVSFAIFTLVMTSVFFAMLTAQRLGQSSRNQLHALQ